MFIIGFIITELKKNFNSFAKNNGIWNAGFTGECLWGNFLKEVPPHPLKNFYRIFKRQTQKESLNTTLFHLALGFYMGVRCAVRNKAN
jgi:hypothetical protein